MLFTIPFNWCIIIIEGEEIKNMTTCMFKGKQYICLEHINEIKKMDCGFYFKKYYNKKQMFKDFLGKVKTITDEGTTELSIDPIKGYDSPYNSHGKVSGQLIYIKDYDYKIEFYRPEHIVDDIDFDISWGESFFVKDDDGQVWFVHINED